MRRTQLYRVMPWVGGINTSVDPGVLDSQELVQADNVQFSSTGARIKREAREYLDNTLEAPDFRSSSGTTRTLTWNSSVLVSITSPEEKLVVAEHINVTGNSHYLATDVPIDSIVSITEITTVQCLADIAGSLANKYFLISAGDSGIDYYIWFNVSGTGVDPEILNRAGVEVAITTDASDTAVALAAKNAIDALTDLNASVSTNMITITPVDSGFTKDATAGTSGFAVTITTKGGYYITYTLSDTFSEVFTAADVSVKRASAVISYTDYWRFSDGANAQMSVFATNNFQLFRLDDSGRRVQIHGQEQTTSVVCTAASTITTGHYFLLNGANNENNYYVWFNKASGGGNPAIGGRTGIEVVIGGGDTNAQVAIATASAIDAVADFSATRSVATVTIVASEAGIATPTVDGNTSFVITTTAYGATTPPIPVNRIKANVFNERLQLYFSGLGDYPIIYNPDDNAKYQLMAPNLATGLQMPDASFAFNFLGRVWANDKQNKDYIHYCETFDETRWLGIGDSGALPVNPGDGDPEGITNGYVYKGFIVTAKKDARFRVIGDSPENFQVQQISAGLGNEGALAIPVDESDVMFVSRRGIHSQQATDQYGDTSAAYVSADIKPTFNSFAAEDLKNIQGTYIPELNSIALAVTEQNKDFPEDVWLYNVSAQVPNKQHPGAWYRWPNVSCTALSRRFISGKHKLVFGTVDGRVVQAQKENDFTDFGTDGIPFKIKTGTIYPGGDPQMMKAFKRITMIYRPKGNFSFAVQAKIDNHIQQGFAFNEISGLDLLGETFILGTSILGSSNTLAPFSFTMEGMGRGVTLTVSQPTADEQIEIWGFIIEYENADLEQEVQ